MSNQLPVPDTGPLFITGCQRSGTTLLQQMCSRHPRLDVMPETHLMPLLWGRTSVIRRLGRPAIADWLRRVLPRVSRVWGWAEMAPRLDSMCDRFRDNALGAGDRALANAITVMEECLNHWSELTGAPRPGEKTPSHIYYLPPLLRALPSARAVVMHRDPRAAGCSEWIKHQSIDEPGRRFGWFRFAVRWVTSVEVARNCEQRFGSQRVLQLRYEDLIDAPEPTARRLCDFLGESFDPEMLAIKRQNSSFADQEVFREEQEVGIRGTTRDRWRQKLDESSVALIESLAGRRMDRLGYEAVARDASGAGRPTKWQLDALALSARCFPVTFYQLATRGRYPGLWPVATGSHQA